MASSFVGAAAALTAAGFGACADKLGVKAPELWAILTVETAGCGFLPDRRPVILFERHIFHSLTNGRFDATAPDLSSATAGGWGAGGANQYDRLTRAIALDENAALQSASWGIGQVMGMNATNLGYAGVAAMVTAFCSSEDQQLMGSAEFIVRNGLAASLRTHDWPSLARGYNGPNYASNRYDTQLASAYQRFAAGSPPDLMVRQGQIALTFLGYAPGQVDGVMGGHTRSAMNEFQASEGIPSTDSFDAPTLTRLSQKVAALPS